MTRIKTAGIAAGFALALVVGILAGGVMSTVSAEDGRLLSGGGTGYAIPAPDGNGWVEWVPGEGLVRKDTLDAEPEIEPIPCSITDGCDVPIAFVTDDGEVIKTLVIRLEDPEPEDAAVE